MRNRHRSWIRLLANLHLHLPIVALLWSMAALPQATCALPQPTEPPAIPTLAASLPETAAPARDWADALDRAIVAHHLSPQGDHRAALEVPAALRAALGPQALALLTLPAGEAATALGFPGQVGLRRGLLQQAVTLQMTESVQRGDLQAARIWRAQLVLPRGASAVEGALLLQTLPPPAHTDADHFLSLSRTLAREAISWQSARVRSLLDQAERSVRGSVPLPGRLDERLGEAMALADLPDALRAIVLPGESTPSADAGETAALLAAIRQAPWPEKSAPVQALRQHLERHLPNLLSKQEVQRRRRLLLKLAQLIPLEYASGVRDGEITEPLEYREAITFTAQARQLFSELAPLWQQHPPPDLPGPALGSALQRIERLLQEADEQIAARADPADVQRLFEEAAGLLTGDLGIAQRRHASTADLIDAAMDETRALLVQSLAAAQAGRWRDAEQLRLEAYTTYDPQLEMRLLPRDPQLALDIERLLLDGIDQPGVKILLDRRQRGEALDAAYARVHEALDRATELLKTGMDPRAAAINAGGILLREGLEGLLVLVAIFAGLRGPEHRTRRHLIGWGVLSALAASLLTYALSRLVITRLGMYGEWIEAITGVLAIVVLLLITNWLFHQLYWRQWIQTLKSTAQSSRSAWQLWSVGFLIGYREGFETVLFLQNLVLETGPGPVGIGVLGGAALLTALGYAALVVGLRLPYFRILLITAVLIGLVLMTFMGTTVRAFQALGCLPVSKIVSYSWPAWWGQWFGLYNTWESVLAQLGAAALVLGTWRYARWQATRKSLARRAARTAA